MEQALSPFCTNPLDPFMPDSPLAITQVVSPRAPDILRFSIPLDRRSFVAETALPQRMN
jgi:hypothetical protein